MTISRDKNEKREARAARLSAALRENLKRRKAQARSRAQNGADHEVTPERDTDIAAQAPDFRRNQRRD